jgi:DNA/RNA endonuclease G (NUC1)/PKD repeat protein
MRRLLKPFALALGLFASVTLIQSCVADRAIGANPLQLNSATASILPAIRISEFHYDNPGTDAGEAIEISGPAGSSVSGWQLVLYNGASTVRASYNTLNLTGTFPSTCGSRGVLVFSYPSNGIQNGSSSATAFDPDGIALVSPTGVVEFLSYEGSFLAASGPAAGMTSLDIGVRELGAAPEPSTAPFFSLARSGSDVWSGPAASTFGSCNDAGEPPTPVVVTSVVVTPTSGTVTVGGTFGFSAEARDASNNPVSGVTFTWSSTAISIATVSASGVATGVAQGDAGIVATTPNGKFGSATLRVDPVTPPPPVRFSEIHYDNGGTDANEAIEVEGPAGTDLTGWNIVLYNGTTDQTSSTYHSVYETLALSGVIAARTACSTRGVLVFSALGLQNGGGDTAPLVPDGLALVDGSGQVIEFLSYEGSFTAANGAAAGMTSKDIGVFEPSNASASQSLQRAADGTTWSGPSASSFGRCTIEGPTPPPNGISFSGRSLTNGDPALPVGYEDQLFATLRDGATNQIVVTTWTWTSETPELASIDANGVMHGLAAGTAVFRATAADGTTATYPFPIEVLQESNAAYQNHAEFGEPTDADNSDDYIVRHREFVSSYNRNRGSPNWVAYNLEQSHFGVGPSDRCDCFTHDPLLPASFPKLTTADYTGAGGFLGLTSPETLDRGHMARSSDRMTHTLDNANTYLLSNIVPQFGDLNQGPWNNFEQYLHDIAAAGAKELFIITGPAGNAGTLKNEGKIVMPTHTWKVAVIMDRDKGLSDVHSAANLEVLAVIMPNVDPRTVDIRNVDWHTYLTTVDAVEALSGYDILALLDDQIEIAVESNTKPPVAAINGPFTGNEGSSISMSGAGSSDPDGDALTYAWSFGDGATASGATTSHTYAQNGNYTVTLTVTDARGLISTTTTTAAVSNVAPTIAFSAATILPGESYSASGSFADPGDDSWSGVVNYGDGSAAETLALSGMTFALAHTYATAGSFTVSVAINDGSVTTTRTATVTVDSWTTGVDKLDLMVAGLGMPRGTTNSLASKLDAARRQIERDQNGSPANVLEAFVNELQALVTSGRLSSSDAAPVFAYAQRIVASLTAPR